MEDHTKHRIESLEEHIRSSSEKTSIQLVNDISFYSYRHANRLFKSLKGEPINAYSNKIRLQKAAEYLKYSAQSVFDIAIEMGYESTASFSKAFKKSYHLSPSAFRKKYKARNEHQLNTSSSRPYTIKPLNAVQIVAQKMTFDLDTTDEAFFESVKSGYQALNSPNSDFVLLWDEDPTQCLFSESRFYLGIENASTPFGDKLPTIEGKYAFFDTAIFKDIDYSEWHEMAFRILELEEVNMRESTYIEYFTYDSLNQLDCFCPTKIAIAIQ